jgi:hypothetical protein
MVQGEVSEEQVRAFVGQINDRIIKKIFKNYTPHCYGHLMTNPINPETIDRGRQALEKFFLENIKSEEEDDEFRNRTITMVKGEEELLEVFDGDQFWHEPLFTVLNEM